MSFWFYSVNMNQNFKSRYCTESTILNTLQQLTTTKVDKIPTEAQNTLDKIKCLQLYLNNRRPTLISKDLYCGDIGIIIHDIHDFCYVDMLNDNVIIRGILYNTYVEYEYNKIKLVGDLNIHTLCSDFVDDLEKINNTVFMILEKIIKKHNISLNKMGVF